MMYPVRRIKERLANKEFTSNSEVVYDLIYISETIGQYKSELGTKDFNELLQVQYDLCSYLNQLLDLNNV